MTARNLKQQRSHHQPLARDELVSLVTRALANGQEEDILSELRLQRPDKFRRDKEPGSPTSPPSMTSDTSSLREYLLLHPNEADDGAPKGPPPPVPVNAPKGYSDVKGSRRGGRSNAPPGSASAGPAPPSTSSSWPSATSDAESTVSSSWMRSPAEAQGDVYILPVQSATALPRGVPTLAKRALGSLRDKLRRGARKGPYIKNITRSRVKGFDIDPTSEILRSAGKWSCAAYQMPCRSSTTCTMASAGSRIWYFDGAGKSCQRLENSCSQPCQRALSLLGSLTEGSRQTSRGVHRWRMSQLPPWSWTTRV
eukprot:s447_g4.t2